MNNQLSCAVHDYLEVACLYGLKIRLWLEDGGLIEGTPRTTHTRADKSEWLAIDNEKTSVDIPLEKVVKFAAITKNRFFSEVTVR